MLLQPNSIYYVRNGTGFDQYITNSNGVIVAYPQNIPTLVQITGQSTSSVMSQKAVTDILDSLGVELGTLRQELNKIKLNLPSEIGDERGGGFYIGDITIPSGDDAGTYMVIMAGKEGESWEKWKLTETNTVYTSDENYGKHNTVSMINAGISEHPAGAYCVNYRGGGFDDWYMPAINEVALASDNKALLGDLEMGSFNFWSSTKSSSKEAMVMRIGLGQKVIESKTKTIRVRPVRRIKKS